MKKLSKDQMKWLEELLLQVIPGEDAEKEAEPDRQLVGLKKAFQVTAPRYFERITVTSGYTCQDDRSTFN